jgi:hypothetical protein
MPGVGVLGGAAAAATAAIAANSEAIANALAEAGEAVRDRLTLKSVTYTRTGPNGQVYAGRTRGFRDPEALIASRAESHPDRLNGFGPPRLDRVGLGFDGIPAIRGREQQLIDFHGGAQSDGGSSANVIRGVAKANPRGRYYWGKSNEQFGPLAPFTGVP